MRGLPKSQKAAQTRGSAPLKTAFSLSLYMAQDEAGDPGRGSMLSLRRDGNDRRPGAHLQSVHVPSEGAETFNLKIELILTSFNGMAGQDNAQGWNVQTGDVRAIRTADCQGSTCLSNQVAGSQNPPNSLL